MQERAESVNEDNRRKESLLNEILPKSVADRLLRGEPVATETYDAVTVFFSDIVGEYFSSKHSEPQNPRNRIHWPLLFKFSVGNCYHVESALHSLGSHKLSLWCLQGTLLSFAFFLYKDVRCNIKETQIETIGDAYMAVSGLPVSNGPLHAREVTRQTNILVTEIILYSDSTNGAADVGGDPQLQNPASAWSSSPAEDGGTLRTLLCRSCWGEL